MKNNVFTWATAAMLLFNVITLQAQTTFTVDNTPNSGAQFTDMQSAINAASDGDTIYVQQSGTPYSGTAANNLAIIVDKSLNLVGRSHTDQFYVTSLGSISFVENSSNSSIKGFSISSINISATVPTTLSNYTISENLINSVRIGQQGSGTNFNVSNINFQGNVVTNTMNVGQNVSNVVLRNSYFTGPSNGGFSFNISEPLNVLISNNIFRPGSGSSSYMTSSGTLNITDSLFLLTSGQFRIGGNFSLNNCAFTNSTSSGNMPVLDNGAAVQNISNGIFNVDGNDFSTCAYNFQFTTRNCDVPANSPLLGAGANGGDIGFQAGFTFKYEGNPKGYPEIKVTNYTGATSSNGTVTFDIEARSH